MSSLRRISPGRSVRWLQAAASGLKDWISAVGGRKDINGKPVERLLLAGLMGFVTLIAILTVAGLIWVELSAASFPSWFDGRPAASPVAEIRGEGGYANILKRPLFARGRQAPAANPEAPPPPQLAAAPAPVPQDEGFVLKGVYIDGARAKAFLVSERNPTGTWVQTDEEIAGWRVVAVAPDHVQLNGGREQLTIPMSFGSQR